MPLEWKEIGPFSLRGDTGAKLSWVLGLLRPVVITVVLIIIVVFVGVDVSLSVAVPVLLSFDYHFCHYGYGSYILASQTPQRRDGGRGRR